MKKLLYEFDTSTSSQEIIEETPVKEDDTISSDKMTRDIQRLSHRLRSSIPRKILYIHARRK
jgi:hypothetical protein